MRRILILIALVVMAFALTGCPVVTRGYVVNAAGTPISDPAGQLCESGKVSPRCVSAGSNASGFFDTKFASNFDNSLPKVEYQSKLAADPIPCSGSLTSVTNGYYEFYFRCRVPDGVNGSEHSSARQQPPPKDDPAPSDAGIATESHGASP